MVGTTALRQPKQWGTMALFWGSVGDCQEDARFSEMKVGGVVVNDLA